MTDNILPCSVTCTVYNAEETHGPWFRIKMAFQYRSFSHKACSTGCVSTVIKVTSVFRHMRKMSMNRDGYCDGKSTLHDHAAHALVQYVRKNRRATIIPDMNGLSAKTVHRERDICSAWIPHYNDECTLHKHWSTETQKKVIWSKENYSSWFSSQRERYRAEYLIPTVRGLDMSVTHWGRFCWHGLGPHVP